MLFHQARRPRRVDLTSHFRGTWMWAQAPSNVNGWTSELQQGQTRPRQEPGTAVPVQRGVLGEHVDPGPRAQ